MQLDEQTPLYVLLEEQELTGDGSSNYFFELVKGTLTAFFTLQEAVREAQSKSSKLHYSVWQVMAPNKARQLKGQDILGSIGLDPFDIVNPVKVLES